MLHGFSSLFTQWFQHGTSYEKIKKNDDFGKEQVDAWKDHFSYENIEKMLPSNRKREWRGSELIQISNCIKELAKALNKIPLTHTTQSLIQDHLVSLASLDQQLRSFISIYTIQFVLKETSGEKAQIIATIIRAVQTVNIPPAISMTARGQELSSGNQSISLAQRYIYPMP